MAKAKSSKNFFGFYGIAESLGKLGFKGRTQNKNFFEILRYRIEGGFCEFVESMRNCRIYEMDSGFCGIVESLVKSWHEGEGFYFWQKPKVAKAF